MVQEHRVEQKINSGGGNLSKKTDNPRQNDVGGGNSNANVSLTNALELEDANNNNQTNANQNHSDTETVSAPSEATNDGDNTTVQFVLSSIRNVFDNSVESNNNTI